jgi:RNA polymerase sigma-70 factor (ECF subfamily)
MQHTDEWLMLAVRNGDVRKLGVLFDRHHQKLFSFFCRLTGNRATAEDLVQDVFFRILKYRKSFRNDSHFNTWMFQIARNARTDFFRKHPAEPSLQIDFDVAGGGPFPNQELEREQESERLHEALLQLPADKRELLVLARYQELRYDEIAELLNVDVGTVKVRVHRAIKQLREIFNKLSVEKNKCTTKTSETNCPRI